MSTNRRYIGARYVPKFFEGVGGSAEWVSGVPYDPLTIVSYNNASYTSKKPVPATVGSPNENPEYWVLTGNYNAQVEEIKTEIDDVKTALSAVSTDVDSLKNKNKETGFILIGDSYGDESAYPDNIQTNIRSHLGDRLLFSACVAGNGFVKKMAVKRLGTVSWSSCKAFRKKSFLKLRILS